MPTYETTKFLSLPQQVNKNKKDIKELQDNQADISNLIPNTEKGQPLGVATLDATGKVPPEQIPSNPGNYLEKTGGTMEGSINMDGYNIAVAGSVETGALVTNDIDSLSGEIQVEVPLSMNNNKITGVSKGTTNGDVATVDNIQDHNTSPFAHADIRNLISAIQGAYIYRGVINENTVDVTQLSLTNRLTAIMSRAPILGDVLTDLDRTDWYFDGTSWDNMGQTFVVLASAVNDGLMSKEDYTKLYDLYTKAQLDATFEVLANKATDFSAVNDTKYPTTKAVAERLLNLPITELNNHTLREVYEGVNKVIGVGKNLFDKSSIVSGSYYNSSGILVSNATSEYGNSFIRVNPNTTYTGNKAMLITTYDLQQNFISRISITNTFTTGSNVYYIIPSHLSQGLGYLDTFQIELGSTATSYEAYKSTENNDLPPFINWFCLDYFGIESLSNDTLDVYYSLYQFDILQTISYVNSRFNNYALKTLEAWLTPTLTGATSTYIRYRKDTLGSVIVEGNITVTTAGTNLTLPVGYRPLFAYTVGILTFNTNGTVVSSATGTQSLSIRFTGGS